MLSQDKVLRIQAEMRDKAQRDAISFGHDKWRYGERRFDEGRKDGLQQGLQQGLQLARQTIVDLCEAYGVEVSADQQAQLEAMDLDRLLAFRDRLKRTRTWTFV